MKKIILYSLFIILSSTLFAKTTIKMAIGEWAPFTSEKNKDAKVLEKIVKEAFKLENIEVIYEYYPWQRSYQLTKIGKADGTFPWYKTKDKLKFFIYHKETLIELKEVFFHLKSFDFNWEKIEDLKKYKVGASLGYSHKELFENNNIKADVIPKAKLNFKKLLLKRIDVFPENCIVGYYRINNIFKVEEANLFTSHKKPLQSNHAYILFSKKTKNGQELADKFDSGLKKLKKSGRYKEIIMEVTKKKQ